MNEQVNPYKEVNILIKLIQIILILLAFLIIIDAVNGFNLSSTNYKEEFVIDYGNTNISSDNFKEFVSVNEDIIGNISSTNYKECLGFYCLFNIRGNGTVPSQIQIISPVGAGAGVASTEAETSKGSCKKGYHAEYNSDNKSIICVQDESPGVQPFKRNNVFLYIVIFIGVSMFIYVFAVNEKTKEKQKKKIKEKWEKIKENLRFDF